MNPTTAIAPVPTLPLGRLMGVSLGPGDPGLITRAAWAQLQRLLPWRAVLNIGGGRSRLALGAFGHS